MTHSPFHGFHFHQAPILTFVMAFVVLAIAGSLVSSVAPWW
jgi:hypothetical protein